MSNTTHTTQNWEIRFDERFVYGDNWATYADGNSPSQYGPKHVKDFIRKELADARREVIEKVKGDIQHLKIKESWKITSHNKDYKLALDDVLATLREEGTK